MSRAFGVRVSGWLVAGVFALLLAAGTGVTGVHGAEPTPGPTQLAQAAAEIGEVTELSGQVTAQRADGGQAALQVGAAVRQGDTLVTGPDASVKVRLADGTQFAMGRGGRMTLNELVYNQQGSDDSLVAEAAQGVFAFVSGQVAKTGDDNMRIETPAVTLGIRGTEFVLEVGNLVRVIRRSGIIDAFNQAGTIQLTQPNEGATFTGPNDPGEVRTFTIEEIAAILQPALVNVTPPVESDGSTGPGDGDGGGDSDGSGEDEDTQLQDGQTQVVELSSGSVVINFPDGITTVVLDDETVAEFNDAIMSTLASVTGTTSGLVEEDLANALGSDVGSFLPGQTVAGPEERLALELLSGQLGGLDTQAGQSFGENQDQPFQNPAQTFPAPPNQTNPLFDGLFTDGTEEDDVEDTQNATPMDTSSP